MQAILTDRNDGVLTVTLNRPDVRNAFDDQLIQQLREVFSAPGDGIRAIVICGAGDVFSAGADLRWMKVAGAGEHADNQRDAQELGELFATIDRCPVVTIAAVHGAAMGGALGIMACCDLVLCARGTKMGFREVRLGLVPAVISPFVVRRIGFSAARRYFVTGEIFPPEQACAMGLAHEVLPIETLMPTALEFAERMKKCGPTAVVEAKQLISELAQLPVDDTSAHTSALIARLRGSSEAQEGITAFLERRAPKW